MKAKIRKIVTVVEETRSEMGRVVDPPTRRAASIAVIENPFAGRYVDDLQELIDIGEELGGLLAQRAVNALGIEGPAGRELRQGCRGGRERRVGACGRDPPPKIGSSGAEGARQGRGTDTVVEEARRAGRDTRYPTWPQGCCVCAKPLRWHRGPHFRRTQGE